MKNIYKVGFIALVATPLFGLFSQNTYAVMPSTFNDEVFYNCVVENFSSQYPDEVIAESGLTNEQLGKMSSLDCGFSSITDTTGLELMTSLTGLSLGGNQLTSIDLSKNVNLTELDLYPNQLTSIDLSKNVNLMMLNLDVNQLTSIDVSKNVNLTELYLESNQLTSIDVSKNVNLTTLNLDFNQLTSIDVSKNVNLTELDIRYNQLTSIDVSKNVNLTRLDLDFNQLTSIDISKNLDLDFFRAGPTVVVETGVLPESDGDLSTYDFSKFQRLLRRLYLANPCYELDYSLSEECVFEWDRENGRLNVSSSLVGSEVEAQIMMPDVRNQFKLKLTEPKPEEPEEPEEDDEAIIVPNTGTQIEDSNNSKALFPIFGMLLGTMTILFGMSLRSSYKRNEYK